MKVFHLLEEKHYQLDKNKLNLKEWDLLHQMV